jgi:uncharacterized OsmC-like protein
MMPDEIVHDITLELDRDYEFLVSFDRLPDVPAIRLDEPAPLGADRGPNAVALLAGAVGNCLSASLLFCLRKSRVDVTGIKAHVAARVARTPTGRLRVSGIDVRIDPEIAATSDPARLARCTALFEDFCVVTESVRRGIPVSVTVEGQARAAAGAGG